MSKVTAGQNGQHKKKEERDPKPSNETPGPADEPTEATTSRILHFPNSLYYDMLEENTIAKRGGTKRTSEKEIYMILSDGLLLRKLLRAKTRKEVLELIPIELHQQLLEILQK